MTYPDARSFELFQKRNKLIKMPIKLSLRPPDTKYVAKVVIFNDDGKVLLLKRKKNQKYPERWDLPGGHLVQGEEWEEGARREVKEETNLLVTDLEKVHQDGKNQYYKTHRFDGTIFDNKELPEHDEYIWIEAEKIDKLNDVGDIYRDAIRRATS